MAKTLQVCHCGCTRRIILDSDVLYLEDKLLGFREQITHIDKLGFINGRWTFPNIRQNVLNRLQPTITKIDQ